MELTFELAPRPGTSLSQRKLELNETRFVAVRNLAHIHYKKPDGTQLMNYSETLGDREVVKQKILEYELAYNLIVNDGSGFTSQPQQAPSTPMNGAQNGHAMQPPQMQIPFNPGAAAPAPQMQQAPFTPGPMGPPAQQQFAPAQQQMAPQQQMIPQQQMAPQTQQMPPQQQPAAPAQEAATAGQKPSRRKAAAAGASVAAPPAAPPAGPPTGPANGQTQGFAPTMAPQQQMMPAAQIQVPAFQQQQMAPVAQMAPVQMMPPTQQQVSPQAAAIDLGPVLAAINQMGSGLSLVSKNGDQLQQQVSSLAALVQQTYNDQQRILAVLHHFYMMHPSPELKQALGDRKTVKEFKEFLTGFSLPAGTP